MQLTQSQKEIQLSNEPPHTFSISFEDFPPYTGSTKPALIQCSKCKALFNSGSKEKCYIWLCEFCNTVNRLPTRTPAIHENPWPQDLLSPIKEKLSCVDDEIVLYLLDASASMSKCNIGAQNSKFKKSWDAIVELLGKSGNSIIVSFSEKIRVCGIDKEFDCSSDRTLKEFLDKYYPAITGLNIPLATVEYFDEMHLYPYGLSGIGSGLAFAVMILATNRTTYNKSKVVLITDGNANYGIGSLYPVADQKFYTDIGDYASQYNVNISVVSIETHPMMMNIFNQLTTSTNGTFLTGYISEAAQMINTCAVNKVHANKVTISLIANYGVKIGVNNEWAEDTAWNPVTQEINRFTDIDLLRFDLMNAANVGEIIVQMRMNYIDMNNISVARVVTKRKLVGKQTRSQICQVAYQCKKIISPEKHYCRSYGKPIVSPIMKPVQSSNGKLKCKFTVKEMKDSLAIPYHGASNGN